MIKMLVFFWSYVRALLSRTFLSKRIFIAVPERWIALDCAGVVCVHPTFSSVPVLLVQLISLDFSQVYALVYYWDQFQKKKSCYACKFLRERIKSRNKRRNQKWVNKRGRETRKQWGRSIGECVFFFHRNDEI